MSEKHEKKFEVLGVPVTNFDATSDFITDVITIDANWVWSFQSSVSGIVGGPPTLTIEVSIDGTNFFPYNINTTDVAIPGILFEDISPFEFIRINYSSNVTTAGTVTFDFTVKHT